MIPYFSKQHKFVSFFFFRIFLSSKFSPNKTYRQVVWCRFLFFVFFYFYVFLTIILTSIRDHKEIMQLLPEPLRYGVTLAPRIAALRV